MATIDTWPNPYTPGLVEALGAGGLTVWSNHDGTMMCRDADLTAVKTLIAGYDPTSHVVSSKLAEAAATRWNVMTGGHTTASGIPLLTDAVSIGLITSLYSAAQAGVAGPFNFKDRAGNWQSLTAAQVTALYQDVSAFVQAAYNREQTLAAQIKMPGQSWQTTQAIDATAGFPVNT